MTTEMNTRLAAFFALFATQVAGCEGGTPDFLGDPAMISGRIANWTKGRGYTLEATQYYIGTLLATAECRGRWQLPHHDAPARQGAYL